jgi:RNA polymerase-binding transcription factor DksA
MEALMSKTKDEIEEAESDWSNVARENGHQCEVCGSDIPYEERKLYFMTGRCGACQSKDD